MAVSPTPRRRGHRHSASDSILVIRLTTRADLDNERDRVNNMAKLTIENERLKKEQFKKDEQIKSQKTMIERLEVKNKNLNANHFNNKKFYAGQVRDRDSKIFGLQFDLNEAKEALCTAEKNASHLANMGLLKERIKELELRLAMQGGKSHSPERKESRTEGMHGSPKRSNLTEAKRGVFIPKEIQQDAVKGHKRRRTNSIGDQKGHGGMRGFSTSP